MKWQRPLARFMVLAVCMHAVKCLDTKPSFTYVPNEDIALPINSTVTLKCEASGSPVPAIKWTKAKNGGDIPSSWITSPGILHIQRFQKSDVGLYNCTAANSLGSVSHVSNLTVLADPVFVRPELTVVKAGSSVSLECQAPKTAKSVLWTTPYSGNFTAANIAKDQIHVDVNNTLHIARTDKQHHGTYSCVMKDDISSLTLKAQVLVKRRPKITTTPVSLQVLVGERVRFTCKSDTYPTPVIEWYKENQNGTTTNLKSYVVQEGTIEIPSASDADVGIYKCIAKNTEGSTIAIATLNVITKPYFETSPRDQLVQIGDDVTLQCQANGSPVPVQRWERFGKPMILESNMQLFPNFTLVISNIRNNQLGEYTCTARNVGGRNSTTLVIRKGDIFFTVIPANSSVEISHDVVLGCNAASTNKSKPVISWTKTGPQGTSTVQEDGRVTIKKTGDLVIKQSKFDDEAWYVCTAENNEGKISTKKIFVDVQYKPKIIELTGPLHQVTSGQLISLKCNVTGDPNPDIKWKSPKGIVIASNSSRYSVSEGFLNITSATVENDAGEWKCQACNLIGCDNSSVTVLITGKPSIRAIEATRNASMVRVRCVAVGKPEPAIKYFLNGTEVSSSTRGHRVLRGVLYIDVVSLLDHYSCTATNKYGKTEEQMGKPQKPSKLVATEITSRNITLSWKSKSTTNFTTAFQIEHRGYDEQVWKRSGAKESEKTTVSNLLPYTKYVFRVRPRNVFGEGPVSEVSEVYRTLAEAPSPPQNLTVVSYRKTLKVRWLPPLHMNGNKDDIVYVIQLLNNSDNIIRSVSSRTETTEFNITEIGKYTISVSTMNTVLRAESKKIRKSVTVINPVPDFVPVIVSLVGMDAHRIMVNWTNPKDTNVFPPIDGYVVYIRKTKEDAEFTKFTVKNVSATYFVISGLKERSRYEVKIAAFNVKGRGSFSKLKETATKYELFSGAAYVSNLQINGWTAAVIAGCLSALCAIICLLVILIQHHRMKKRDSVSFVKPSQALSKFYAQNPNIRPYTDDLSNSDNAFVYGNLAYGDQFNDDYVEFIKAKWCTDYRLDAMKNRKGADVWFTRVNPAFCDDVDNKEELLHDHNTDIYQPVGENFAPSDCGLATIDGDPDENFLLLPKPNEVNGRLTRKPVEHVEQEVKIDFSDDTSVSSAASYDSRRPPETLRNLFIPPESSLTHTGNIT